MDTATILVVEDDDDLRLLVATVLSDAGYSVLSAGNAEEALRILEAEPGVDLLFTDIVMPGAMDGFALARAAVARRSTLKVLYTTGYTPTEDGERAHGPLLRKPYRPSQILEQLSRLLGDAPTRSLP
jgi:CheY-like chemotaxis protein